MNFVSNAGLKQHEVYSFWRCVEDSYTIEQMFELHENVLVTLSENERSLRFIYFKAKRGRGIRILKADNTYAAVLWLEKKKIGGNAEGVEGKLLFQECLRMFQESLRHGEIVMDAEKCPYPPSQYVPLTEREQKVLQLIEAGTTSETIRAEVAISHDQLIEIRKALKMKGKLARVGIEEYEDVV